MSPPWPRTRRPRRRPLLLLLAVVGVAAACAAPAPDLRDAAPRAVPAGAGAACASSAPDAEGVVGAIVRADRGCGEVAAVLYECAPRFDPVLVFGGTSVRAFAGGRFAVPVREIPSSATVVGVVGGLRVAREPGRAGRVFVEGADGVERWLALPGPGAVDPASAFVVGDSIAVGAATPLVHALPEWSTAIDAEVGRLTQEAVPILAETLPDASAVVVELGTNDVDLSTFAASARSILDDLAGERLVVWVAPHAPTEIAGGIRNVIDRLVARTHNGVVADWDAAVPSDALAPDGVHLLPERVGVFAEFLAGYLRTWRMAVAGAGPAGCAARA